MPTTMRKLDRVSAPRRPCIMPASFHCKRSRKPFTRTPSFRLFVFPAPRPPCGRGARRLRHARRRSRGTAVCGSARSSHMRARPRRGAPGSLSRAYSIKLRLSLRHRTASVNEPTRCGHKAATGCPSKRRAARAGNPRTAKRRARPCRPPLRRKAMPATERQRARYPARCASPEGCRGSGEGSPSCEITPPQKKRPSPCMIATASA